MSEIKRLADRRFFAALAALLLFNGVLLMSFHMKNKAEADVYDALIKLTAEYKQEKRTCSEAFSFAWKQYIEENHINRDTVTEAVKSAKELISQKIKYMDGYPSFVEEKMNFSQSVLSTDVHEAKSFERINLYKTYVDLSRVKDAQVELSNGRWLEVLYEYEYIPVFVIFILGFCVYRFFTEKKNGLYFMIHTGARGRAGLLVKRALFLFAGAFVVSVLFYFESSWILLKIYGGGESLLLPAASDEMFFLTAGNLSRLGFVCVQAAVCAGTAFSLVLLLWLVLRFFNNVNIGVFAYLLVLGAELVLHALIHAKTALRALKYINLYYLLNPHKAIKYYNWGYDFGVMELCESTLLLAAVLAVVSFLLHFHISTRRYFSGKNNLFERGANCVMTWIMRGIGALPLVFQEIYKVLVSQRAAVVLALLLYMVSRINIGIPVMYNGQSAYVSQYYDRAGGMEYSQALELEYGFFEDEYEAFLADIDVHDEGNRKLIQNYQMGLQEMRANVDYLKNLKEKGVHASVLKPYEYNAAFGPAQSRNQAWLALLNILAVIILSAGFISYEKRCNVHVLVTTYQKRRQWLVRKAGVNVLLIGMFEGLSYGIYYTKLFGVYELEGFTAPIKSLPMFEKSPINPSIAGFIIIDLLMKFLMLVALSSFLCLLSRHVKWLYCVVAGLVVTIPQFLYGMGFEALEKWSIGRYVACLPVFNDASQSMAIYYIFAAAVIVSGGLVYGSLLKKDTIR